MAKIKRKVLKKEKIGVVTALFNSQITKKLEAGALEFLQAQGYAKGEVTVVRVPGAFEIPLAAKYLFESGCSGVVALGAVIQGETAHFDFVCRAVERGCSQLQLQYGRPIGFGVLTTDDEAQAMARAGGKEGNKGKDAAEAMMDMLNLKQCILYPKEDK